MPESKVNVFSYWRTLFAAVLLTVTAPALAQDAEENENRNKTEEEQKEESRQDNLSVKSGKKFERVEVTGSLIRRADFEGPSPIELIDRKALDETAYNSVADYVRDLPISSFGSAKESSGSTAAGVSTINLRGLGSTNTLVLLNGSRLPIDGNLGAVNMNLIPEIIVDGVEILKDGASATYGSDAIGGVVAIKSRKNFNGLEVSAKGTVTEEAGGSRTDLGLLYGKQLGEWGPFTNSSVTMAAQYRQNDKIFDRDREWSEADDQGVKGWSRTSSVPTYRDSAGNVNFIPEQCAAQGGFVETDGPNSYCLYPFADRSTSLPSIQQLSGYVNVELEMGTRDRISTTALVSRQVTQWAYAPSPGGFFADLEIPASKAGTIYEGGPLPGTTGTEAVPFAYRTAVLGDRVTETSNDSYYIQSEYAHEFGETWEWKNSLSYSSNDKNAKSISGYALTQPFLDAIASNDPATSFNPFDPADDGAALESARYKPFQKTTSNSVVADTRVNGELLSFGSNDQNVLGAALGLQYIHSEFKDAVDQPTADGLVFGNAGSNGGGQRDVMAAYTEFALSLGRMWEFQAAARYDKFSDFGDAFSPKVGVKFRPFDNFMMRASYGKAFKAPLLLNLYASDSIGFPSFIDRVKCTDDQANGNPGSAACRESQYQVQSGGNPDLEEERATSYGVGFVYEPLKGLAIGSDYWIVDQTNVVGIDYEEMTKAELAGVDLSQAGVTVTRDPGDNSILGVVAPTLNLSSKTQSGIDLNVSYTFKSGFGRFRLADSHSQTFEFEQAGFIGVPKRNYLDDYGSPEWRNTASLTYSPNRNHAISLVYQTVAGQKNVARDGRISSYGELELAYTTQLSYSQGTTLTAGVKNITGETPPYDPNGGSSPFNASLYSQVQRYGYLNLRHAF